MSKNRYYYYDHESCTFVEMVPDQKKRYLRYGMWGGGTLVFALILALLFGDSMTTPSELALKAENEALKTQLEETSERMGAYSEQLEEMAEADQQLYRTLLQAEPIGEDVRQVGVGGADLNERFDVFRRSTSDLLSNTAEQLDELERKISLQSSSYRELTELASQHEERLAQLPALKPIDGPIVSSYGMRTHPVLQVRQMHHGVDILVDIGTPIYAPGDGVVREVSSTSAYGNFLVIEHPEAGYNTLYAHLSEVPSHVTPGSTVSRGDEIAFSGNTGRTTGPHLHYEVRDSSDQPVNPSEFFTPGLTPSEFQLMIAQSDLDVGSLH